MADLGRRRSRADRRRSRQPHKGKERRRGSLRDVTIGVGQGENCVEIKLQNELVAGNCQPIKEKLLKAHFQLPVSGVVILDLQMVPYVDSGGAAMLLEIHERMKRNGKTLVLKNLNEHVARVIEMLNLTTVFNIHSDK